MTPRRQRDRAIGPDSVFSLPYRLSFEEGAALPMNYLSAQFARAAGADEVVRTDLPRRGQGAHRRARCGRGDGRRRRRLGPLRDGAPGFMAQQCHKLVPMRESGVIAPPVGATHPIGDFGRALQEMQDRKTLGKTVLIF